MANGIVGITLKPTTLTKRACSVQTCSRIDNHTVTDVTSHKEEITALIRSDAADRKFRQSSNCFFTQLGTNCNRCVFAAGHLFEVLTTPYQRPKKSAGNWCQRNAIEQGLVVQPNSDLGVDLALESTQCFMTVFDTTWPIYSESG